MLHIPSFLNTTKLTKIPKSYYLSRASIQAIEDELLHNPSQVIQDHSRANRTTNCLRQWLHAPHPKPYNVHWFNRQMNAKISPSSISHNFRGKTKQRKPSSATWNRAFSLTRWSELELRGLRLGLRRKRRRCERFRQLSTELRLRGFQKGEREEKGGSITRSLTTVCAGVTRHGALINSHAWWSGGEMWLAGDWSPNTSCLNDISAIIFWRLWFWISEI